LTADRLRNGGRIASDGELRITLPTADDALRRPSRRAARQVAPDMQAAALATGSLSNSGTLTAGGELSLTGGAITNAGRLDSRT
ncbi:hypothetical protein, partial [Dickeya dianthicola]